MKSRFFLLILFTSISNIVNSQVVLNADGTTDTYSLINTVLANPNRNVVEVPDCNHEIFGDHITQEYDNDLKKNVFLFHIHVTPDNDRCKKFDRQRNEIKTYKDSPENLKATIGETVAYKWKFKLPKNFKPSSSFTHIHQIKAVGGPYASIPMISLTLRKGNPDKLELRYTPTKSQKTLDKVNLDLLKGNWIEVTEVIKFDNSGSYSIEIKNVENEKILFSYKNSPLDTWQDGADFARPKWGIYRSLKNKQDLQDEILKYANFSIEEIKDVVPVDVLKAKAERILLMSNSSNEIVFNNSGKYDAIELFDNSGRKISIEKRINKNKLNVSGFSKGLYFIVFKKDTLVNKVLKCYVK
ncbi:MAG: heparin lyase I family protein [Polaribacter sp.]|uniref:heparin lyase I family protein n=1 Tax=Polaribacter sp. TaxID=1920175 RepID=UPI0032664BF5